MHKFLFRVLIQLHIILSLQMYRTIRSTDKPMTSPGIVYIYIVCRTRAPTYGHNMPQLYLFEYLISIMSAETQTYFQDKMKDSITDQRVRSLTRACRRPSTPTGAQIKTEPAQILTAAAVTMVVCGVTPQGTSLLFDLIFPAVLTSLCTFLI